MTLVLYVPQNFNPSSDSIGLLCNLHGGGGLGSVSPDLQAGLDARNWIGIAPDGRNWGLADPTFCANNPNAVGARTWCTSAAYLDNPVDPNVGPGEQDIFDAIDWAVAGFNINTDRVYLTGFSMGGRGTYNIGLKNPDRFAAIAPRGPAIDMYEIFVRRPESCACKEGMVSGHPGESPFVDTMYTITSGRFLIENAFNLPVFHAHGTLDTIANNTVTKAPFLHSWHITNDETWTDPFTTPATLAEFGNSCLTDESLLPIVLGFGHTPTLSELRSRHPEGYDWAFMFTPVGHTGDSKWFTGTPIAQDDFGVEDPLNPGNLLGLFDFFDRRTLVHDPETVVFKTYTDTHRKAYWAQIDITAPWQDTYGRGSEGHLPTMVRHTRVIYGSASTWRVQSGTLHWSFQCAASFEVIAGNWCRTEAIAIIVGPLDATHGNRSRA